MIICITVYVSATDLEDIKCSTETAAWHVSSVKLAVPNTLETDLRPENLELCWSSYLMSHVTHTARNFCKITEFWWSETFHLQNLIVHCNQYHLQVEHFVISLKLSLPEGQYCTMGVCQSQVTHSFVTTGAQCNRRTKQIFFRFSKPKKPFWMCC